jgi:thioredoxin reductase (NADPH)
VGAGNSAGQASVDLAKHAASVTILVRGDALGQSMSDYLVQQIERAPNIAVRLHTEVVDGQGGRRLEGLSLRDKHSGAPKDVPAAALFVMIGAEPRTEWLAGSIERDDRGYILTGHDLEGCANSCGACELSVRVRPGSVVCGLCQTSEARGVPEVGPFGSAGV